MTDVGGPLQGQPLDLADDRIRDLHAAIEVEFDALLGEREDDFALLVGELGEGLNSSFH